LQRYGIDRQTLSSAGVKHEDVDRLYKSLFVHSVGFFELLRNLLNKKEKQFAILTAVWKVYQVLLEYCCKTDYRILLAEISERHEGELRDIEAKYKNEI
jgi:hypothetical protein